MSTLTMTAKPPKRQVIDAFRLRRFSTDEYHKMIESGILTSNARVELLEGWIIKKMSQNPPHAGSVCRINRWLGRCLPDAWSFRCQGPITLADSEPEPDFTLARGEQGTYDCRHPGPSDIGIVLEVADSTLLADRRYKGTLYANEKIPEFWLINLVKRKIEVYTKPRGGKYGKKVEYAETDAVPLILDGVKVADVSVAELMAKM